MLQHPREARAPFNTVRILRQALSDIVVCVGIDFTQDTHLTTMLDDPTRRPIVLFPGKRSAVLVSGSTTGPLTLIVVDGTWSQARSLMGANPWLADLRQFRLMGGSPSLYGLREQPEAGYLSTVEAVAEALAIVDGDVGARESLLAPLRAMVGLQLACADAGTSAVLADRELLERAGYVSRPP